MPPSALISVHTVGCAWRLLMCYVNTLPKCRRRRRRRRRRRGRNVPCVPVSCNQPPPAREHLARCKSGGKSRKGVDRGKLMRLPAGRYRTPLSYASTRLTRRKRESLRREVPEFKRRSRVESGARSWPYAGRECAKNTARDILKSS